MGGVLAAKVNQETSEGCFRACIASLLGKSFWDIPDYFQDTGHEDNMTRMQEWLRSNVNIQLLVIRRENQVYNNSLQLVSILGKSPPFIMCFMHFPDENDNDNVYSGHAMIGQIQENRVAVLHDPDSNNKHRDELSQKIALVCLLVPYFGD